MSDDDDMLEDLRRGINAKRGYADFDTWPDQAARDLGIGQDFAAALCAQHQIELAELRAVPRGFDPPDLVAGPIGIELTELVDPKLVSAAARQKHGGIAPSQYRGWSGDQLLDRLREIIVRKDAGIPKEETDLSEYWVVIHTDEPGLTPDMVTSHLKAWAPVPCRLVTRCFLLMSYFPSHDGRPLFELLVSGAA